ncbi:MAG: hypothetical protein IH630_01455 [Thermoplasmata archaeon]|nr:hypothetical protein [Thermoplasmata archaeon]TFG70791.1 MAG: hypothetical protein E4H25_01010 [Methanomassiliicoccus sp.]
MRTCNRCRQETNQMFCPTCRVLTHPEGPPEAAPTSAAGDSFECTIWQGPNRSRGIEVPVSIRDKYFSKRNGEIIIYIDGRRAVVKLGTSFWKKPAVMKKAFGDNGKDELIIFFEKHHLLPPQQSLKEKGIVDTLVFEVVTPKEEFKVTVVEKHESDEYSSD